MTGQFTPTCFHNRTRILSFVPQYVAVDDECDEPATRIVMAPSYGEPHCPEFWPVRTCAEHEPVLVHELTHEDEHGFPREDLVFATIDTPVNVR